MKCTVTTVTYRQDVEGYGGFNLKGYLSVVVYYEDGTFDHIINRCVPDASNAPEDVTFRRSLKWVTKLPEKLCEATSDHQVEGYIQKDIGIIDGGLKPSKLNPYEKDS